MEKPSELGVGMNINRLSIATCGAFLKTEAVLKWRLEWDSISVLNLLPPTKTVKYLVPASEE